MFCTKRTHLFVANYTDHPIVTRNCSASSLWTDISPCEKIALFSLSGKWGFGVWESES